MRIVLRGTASAVTLERCLWDGEWQAVAGIFAFVDDSGAQTKVLFIGETANFSETMRNHPLWAQAVRLGATSVYAAPTRDGNRAGVVADLAGRYRPVLQPGGRHAAGAQEATAPVVTGVHDILDGLTEKVEQEAAPSGINEILDDMFAQVGSARPGAVATRFAARDADPTRTETPRRQHTPTSPPAAGLRRFFGFGRGRENGR